jgi:transcriptional regulator with XRE-family HTH domain
VPTPSDVAAKRVREVRRKRGLTVAQLAERCAVRGMPGLTEQALYNLEAGRADKRGRRRRAVTVDELLVLGLALDVAPVHLLVSPDHDDEPYQITPARGEPAGAVRDWIRGVPALAGIVQRDFYNEVPEPEWHLSASGFPDTSYAERRRAAKSPEEKQRDGIDQLRRLADDDPELSEAQRQKLREMADAEEREMTDG